MSDLIPQHGGYRKLKSFPLMRHWFCWPSRALSSTDRSNGSHRTLKMKAASPSGSIASEAKNAEVVNELRKSI